jgi:hypothetical protein
MERFIHTRKISKFRRKELGNPEEHLHDLLQKPFLTKRDKEVLLAVYYHRCLTTEQIAEIFFKYNTKGEKNNQSNLIARRRLRKMFDAYLLDRFFVDVGEGNGSSPAHVILDTIGAKVVAGLLNLPMSDINWRYEMNEARLPYLEHMVKINQFYVYLLRKARNTKGEVLGFRTENHVRYEFKHWNERIIFNPDAYGQYWQGDEGFHFFLELDNGTMSPKTFEKKHQRYSAFYDSGEYRKHYENFPIILTVTTTEERAKQLRDIIYKRDNTDMIWLFASWDKVKVNPTSTIWLGKEKDPVRLL